MEKLLNRKVAWILFGLIIVIAVGLRTYDIEIRPMHNDEGVNYHFIKRMKGLGYFPYSHENYHGPSYFYLTYGMTEVTGDDVFDMRLSAIVVGIATIVMLLMLLRLEGWGFVLISAFMTAISTCLVYYNRYAIHETLFLYSGALYALSIYLWHRFGKIRYIYYGLLGLAIHIGTKETFIITIFCSGLAFLAMGQYKMVLSRLYEHRLHFFQASLLSLLLLVIMFTGGFQWMGGLREMFLAVPQWVGRNESDVGHFKPFMHYTYMLLGPGLFEPIIDWLLKEPPKKTRIVEGLEPQLYLVLFLPFLLLVGRFLSGSKKFFKREDSFGWFLAIWGFSSWAVYSYVDYKTPWLIMNLSFPLVLFLGWLLKRLWSFPTFGKSFFGPGALLVTTVLGVQLCLKYNFEVPYGETNPLSYVHTHQGMVDFLEDLEEYTETVGKEPPMLVGVKQYWPLPYYLRNRKLGVAYTHKRDFEKEAPKFDVMVLDKDIKVDSPEWARKYYRLSDVQEAQVYFKR